MTKTILIVDDDPVVLHLLTATLESVGHIIATQKSGTAALAGLLSTAAADPLPDLLVLDLQLEDIKGTEVLEQLRNNETTKDLCVLLLSANAEHEVVSLYPKAELANAFLQKPFEMKTVINIVAELTN